MKTPATSRRVGDPFAILLDPQENLEAALARLPGIAGEARTTNGSTKSNWEFPGRTYRPQKEQVLNPAKEREDPPDGTYVCQHDTLKETEYTPTLELLHGLIFLRFLHPNADLTAGNAQNSVEVELSRVRWCTSTKVRS